MKSKCCSTRSVKLPFLGYATMPKFPEISVQTQMERFDPGGNFPVKVVHLHRWSSLTGRSGPTETSRSISKNSRFQSYVANQ